MERVCGTSNGRMSSRVPDLVVGYGEKVVWLARSSRAGFAAKLRMSKHNGLPDSRCLGKWRINFGKSLSKRVRVRACA